MNEEEKTRQHAVAALLARGWTVDWFAPSRASQAEGRLPDGKRFYFHAAEDAASLAVGGDDPADGAPWVGHIQIGPENGSDASWMTAHECLEALLELAARYTRDEAQGGWG